MTLPAITPSQVRAALLLRDEIALLDVRHEAAFATGHPLFAANMAAGRIALEAGARLPRKDVPLSSTMPERAWLRRPRIAFGRWAIPTFASSTAGCRAGRRRATNCSRMSTPTPRPSANWSSPRRHTPVIAGGRSRRADRGQGEYRDPRCPAVRRIRHHEHSRLRQRARRRTGAACRPRGTGSRDHHHRQLRRPHPVDHRYPVADQCRRHQQGGGVAKRYDRLDSGETEPRARR